MPVLTDVRSDRTGRRVARGRASRAGRAAVVAAALAATAGLGLPSIASAAHKTKAVPAGLVYGTRTAQGYGVELELAHDRRHVKQAAIGFDLACAPSGDILSVPESFAFSIPISKSGKFGGAFEPQVIDLGAAGLPGVSAELTGSIAGTFNHARTKVALSWTKTVVMKITATMQVIDTCTASDANLHLKQ